jgi:hypothetical protein
MSEGAPRTVRTARQATSAVVEWLRAAGYTDAREVDEAPEGVDAVSRWCLAQVRFGDAAVRRTDLQRLSAARGERTDLALFAFASSKFEVPALTYADAKSMLLFTFDEWGTMTPRSAAARVMIGGPRAAVASPLAPDELSGFWLALVRHAPLALAVLLLGAAAMGLAAAAQGDGGAVGAVIRIVAAVALAALWFFVTRRWRPPGARPKTPAA